MQHVIRLFCIAASIAMVSLSIALFDPAAAVAQLMEEAPDQ
jgi:hypothetical protein